MPGAYHAEPARQASTYDYEKVLNPANGETQELSAPYVLGKVVTPASGTGKVKVPAASLCPMMFLAFQVVNTGGGEVQLVDADGSTDLLGDNFSAVDDYAVIFSNGSQWIKIAEVTT